MLKHDSHHGWNHYRCVVSEDCVLWHNFCTAQIWCWGVAATLCNHKWSMSIVKALNEGIPISSLITGRAKQSKRHGLQTPSANIGERMAALVSSVKFKHGTAIGIHIISSFSVKTPLSSSVCSSSSTVKLKSGRPSWDLPLINWGGHKVEK